ncbi:hypothetical protein [Mycolicibacterium hodleri]|uniref:hypothetical protein n=1 Tax=Mycolicibacterium hodleri TaxID=49897 RepID=UPI001375E43C|nr:hypothetical protein [Mycolicibacterium hodleri]
MSNGYWSTVEAGGASLIWTFPGESTFAVESQTATAGSQGGSARADGAATIAAVAQAAAKRAATPHVLNGDPDGMSDGMSVPPQDVDGDR